MRVLTAVEEPNLNLDDKVIFLAGGITNCREWQDEVIDILSKNNIPDNFIIANPRRKNFPIHDPNASEEQIKWEFNMLEKANCFSMFFDGQTPSDQPICFYELGRNIVRMKEKFANTENIIVTVDETFKRHQDVVIQSKLAGVSVDVVAREDAPAVHATRILDWIEIHKNKYFGVEKS